MPINLANRLESLCGYRLIYQPNDPKAKLNPVAFSHMKLAVAGKTVSILSRVTAFGSDYSGRTNKIAHHVVLDPKEHTSNGPSDQLLYGNILKSTWDGVCSSPVTGPRIADRRVEAGVCVRWQGLGDSGWAGVIADAWLKPNSKICWIIFDEKQSQLALELIQEAVLLLPEEQRWNATFNTYFTSQPPDVDCRVRFVLAESEEARMAQARGIVIDITKPLGKAADSPSVLQARLGKSIVGEQRVPIEQVPKLGGQLDLPFRPGTAAAEKPLVRPKAKSVVGYEDSSIEFQLAKLEPEKKQTKQPKPLALPPSMPGVNGKKGATPPAMPSFQKPSSMPWIIAAAAVAGLLFLLVCGIVVVQQIEQRKLLAEANAKKLEDEEKAEKARQLLLTAAAKEAAETAKRIDDEKFREKTDRECKIEGEKFAEAKRTEASARLAALDKMKNEPIEFEVGGAPPEVLMQLSNILSDDRSIKISGKPVWLQFENGIFDGSPQLADLDKSESAKIEITVPDLAEHIEIKCKVFNRIGKGKDIRPIRLEIVDKSSKGNLFQECIGVSDGYEVLSISEAGASSIAFAEKIPLGKDPKQPNAVLKFQKDGNFELSNHLPLEQGNKAERKLELRFALQSNPNRVFVTKLDLLCKAKARQIGRATISIDTLILNGLARIIVETDHDALEKDLDREVSFNMGISLPKAVDSSGKVTFEAGDNTGKTEKETISLAVRLNKKIAFALNSKDKRIIRPSAFSELIKDKRTSIVNDVSWLEEFEKARDVFLRVASQQEALTPRLAPITDWRTKWIDEMKAAVNDSNFSKDGAFSIKLIPLLMDSVRIDLILQRLSEQELSPEIRGQLERQLDSIQNRKWFQLKNAKTGQGNVASLLRNELAQDRLYMQQSGVVFSAWEMPLQQLTALILRFKEATSRFAVKPLTIVYGIPDVPPRNLPLDFELNVAVEQPLLDAIKEYQTAIIAIRAIK